MKEQQKAPEQARVEELSEHFDQTDVGVASLAEFEEVEDVVIERSPELAPLSVRIPPEDLAALRQQAERASIGYTTLIRMIIRDHLNSSHGANRRLSVWRMCHSSLLRAMLSLGVESRAARRL